MKRNILKQNTVIFLVEIMNLQQFSSLLLAESGFFKKAENLKKCVKLFFKFFFLNIYQL